MIDIKEVEAALQMVEDPELGFDIITLGLVYDIVIEEDSLHVEYTLTTPGCPYGEELKKDMENVLSQLQGVNNISLQLTFMPPWTIEHMDEDARFALGFEI